jgi:hypothetical protein
MWPGDDLPITARSVRNVGGVCLGCGARHEGWPARVAALLTLSGIIARRATCIATFPYTSVVPGECGNRVVTLCSGSVGPAVGRTTTRSDETAAWPGSAHHDASAANHHFEAGS